VCATSEQQQGVSCPVLSSVKSCQIMSGMAGPAVCATSMRKVDKAAKVVFDVLGKTRRRACVRMSASCVRMSRAACRVHAHDTVWTLHRPSTGLSGAWQGQAPLFEQIGCVPQFGRLAGTSHGGHMANGSMPAAFRAPNLPCFRVVSNSLRLGLPLERPVFVARNRNRTGTGRGSCSSSLQSNL
jgi:hypothetical protein